jgi:MoxR-like ATPase
MFVIDETKKQMLATLIRSGKNCLLTGATGCGKTTLCLDVAEELGMNVQVFNMGSTQDARTSLIGYHVLEDGNTRFQLSDFIRAIQTPNTLIVLDELSRASDDAFNIIFPLLDFRKDIRIEELAESGSDTISVEPTVKFIATANIGLDYSSARSLDRALKDRFIPFHLDYIKGKELSKYITHLYDGEISKKAKQLVQVYDYSHQQYKDSKISSQISTRMVLECIPLMNDFSLADILNNVLLAMYEEDSCSVVNDANIIREYADSLGMFAEKK